VGNDRATYSWTTGEKVWRTENGKPTTNGVALTQQGGPYLWGNEIHCPGGDGVSTSANVEEIFNLITRTWSTGPSWGVNYNMLNCVSIPWPATNRQILVAGIGPDPKQVICVDQTGAFVFDGGLLDFPDGYPFRGVVIPYGNTPIVIGSAGGYIQVWNGASFNAHTSVTPFRPMFSTCVEIGSGEWLIAGGIQNGASAGNAAVRIDAETTVQAGAGSMNKKRKYHSAIPMEDGRILVIGGQDETNAYLSDAEIYDPDTNTWTATDPRPVAASNAAIESLGGYPCVIGGENGGGSLVNVNIFDPNSERWLNGIPDPNA
jgi:hypothetical protein